MEYIACFGDSLTQFGYQSGWVSRLSNHYIRKAVTLNLGLSGYNSRWVLDVLTDREKRARLIPHGVREPLFATLLLGSNDMSTNLQGIPLEEFVANIEAIIQFIHLELKPKHGIFVMTPPPVDEIAWKSFRGLAETDRTLAATRTFRAALVKLVADCQDHHPEYGVQLVDTHSAILHHANPATALQAAADPSWEPTYDPQAPYTRLLVDGLHINEVGGEIFFSCLLDAIRKSPGAAQLEPEAMAWPLPDRLVLMEQERQRREALANAGEGDKGSKVPGAKISASADENKVH